MLIMTHSLTPLVLLCFSFSLFTQLAGCSTMTPEGRLDFLDAIKHSGIDLNTYSTKRGIVWVRKDLKLPYSIEKQDAAELNHKLKQLKLGYSLSQIIKTLEIRPDEIWLTFGTDKKIANDSTPQGVMFIYLESKISHSGSIDDMGARGILLKFDSELKLRKITATLLSPVFLKP